MGPRRVGKHVAGGRQPEQGPEAALRDGAREAFARWASGVALVATRADGRVHALTATAVMPVSLDPPLVLVGLGGNAAPLPFLGTGAELVISMLTTAQRAHASRYADSFPVGPTPFPAGGPPVAEGALEALICTVEERLDRGDHSLFVCRIHEVRHGAAGARPLVYFDRDYGTFAGRESRAED